jgi:hypothetical protein
MHKDSGSWEAGQRGRLGSWAAWAAWAELPEIKRDLDIKLKTPVDFNTCGEGGRVAGWQWNGLQVLVNWSPDPKILVPVNWSSSPEGLRVRRKLVVLKRRMISLLKGGRVASWQGSGRNSIRRAV